MGGPLHSRGIPMFLSAEKMFRAKGDFSYSVNHNRRVFCKI